MRRTIYVAATVGLALMLVACGGKKKSEDIITQRVEKPTPQSPVRMQDYSETRKVQWIGRTYSVAYSRQAADSLPMVKDETGQRFVDNTVTIAVTRADGSLFYSRTFTKHDFATWLDDDYRKTGVLEGLVFVKADGNYLEFAASVSHPQTDEYIPLVVRLSRMGDLSVKRDTELDTSARTEEDDV